MKKLLYILFFSFFTAIANAELFELSVSETRDNYSFVQFQYGTGKGKPFAEVFSQIKLEKDTVAIRILGDFSENTNGELMSYYEKEIPSELQAAIKSSGNLHNPALRPLVMSFSAAFKETSLYLNIEKELFKAGYEAAVIEFEKYTINTKGPPKIWVADIWLKFSKSPNNSKHADLGKLSPFLQKTQKSRQLTQSGV
ncbi:MAG: hypothetical protein ACRBCI_12090 [Cellvibrionaceae bacterium]